ncbi:MAG: RNA 2',3'-cyclic phosphodiesterase [Gammaproteobacteria bacterium]|nr:RNA 2',3'-cyclic phosphodiesterase [Gammaproteobacteria bacterium]
MRQRYFFGLQPPPALVAELAAAIHRFGQQLDRTLGAARQNQTKTASWHHPQDLHLTLVFLGDLDWPLERVKALAEGVAVEPFALSLGRLDHWRKPQVVVLEPLASPNALVQLAGNLQQAGLAAGLHLDQRPYRPHLTLARKAAALDAQSLDQLPVQSLIWPVSDFCLFVSDWSGPPPHYQVVARWPLNGAGAGTVPSDGSVQ